MTEATVLEFNNTGFEGEEGMEFENGLETGEVEVQAVNNKHDLIKGLAIGFGAGAALGAVAWFVERGKRLEVLKQLEETTFIAAGLAEGKDSVTYNKKEIDLANLVMKNPDDLVMNIMDNLDKPKFMFKKERKRWKNTLQNIVELSVYWNERANITKKEQQVEPENVTETLVEN